MQSLMVNAIRPSHITSSFFGCTVLWTRKVAIQFLTSKLVGMLLRKININYQKSVKCEKKLLKINSGNSSVRNCCRKERKFTTKGATSQVPTSLNVSFFTRFVYLKHSAFQIPNSGKYFWKFQGIWSRRNLSLVNLPRLFLGFWKSFKTGKGLASLHKISINFKSYCDRNDSTSELFLEIIRKSEKSIIF